MKLAWWACRATLRQIPVRIVGRHEERAGLARALALDLNCCPDEPTAGLDHDFRQPVRRLIKAVTKALGLTFAWSPD